ncbi:methyltransferase domain-containing protein [Rickettsiales bacterium]|nr:methyltransferase domain-containing protein [Rickettsiales bacterium]
MMKNKIKRSFDHGSRHYDKHNEIQNLAGKELIDFFFMNLTKEQIDIYNKKKLTILDLGCGTGEFSMRIIKNFKVESIELMDLSSEMIKVSKSKIKNTSSKFFTKDFDAYNGYEKFDMIVSNMSLHWSLDINKLCRSIASALKPSSIFLFSVPNNQSFMNLKNVFSLYGRDFSLNDLPSRDILSDFKSNDSFSFETQSIRLLKKFKNPLYFFYDLKKIGANAPTKIKQRNLFFLKKLKNFSLEADYNISCYMIKKIKKNG